MEEYTLKTVKLLLERNREYLFDILNKLNIKANDKQSAEDICRLLYNHDDDKKTMHESSIYKCNKCGSKYITTEEIQIRSLDEGSSIIYFCHACGNKW